MSLAWMSLLFGLGVSGWIYSQLAKRTGNPNPANNFIAAGFIGLVVALIFFTLLKFMFNF